MNILTEVKHLLIVLIGLLLFSLNVFAQKDLRYIRHGWWASGGVGPGFLKSSFTKDTAQRSGKFGINLKGGYAVSQFLLTGVEFNGWNLSSRPFLSFDGNRSPSNAATDMLINTAFLLQTYPLRWPVYLKASLGWCFYIPTSKTNQKGNGMGYSIGTGYEYIVNNNFGFGVSLNYDFGNLKDRTFSEVQILPQRRYDIINLGLNFIIY
ncbi:outer membrane beta-barrel protein [Solitalea lacus]|uniref:outer membrane beta-barrel protein n=1 Tax=Solitalea lacus TaxID=2911172 RepID=UPI001EDAD939|nr:outer membrane beta-barrel protein [Solitalea lacus]UKJ06072.1 outer membrane beta-barrel protein [Solitalea lacus]